MTTPATGSSSSAAKSQWWVLAADVPGRGQPPFQAIQSATRPKDTAVSRVAAGPFPTQAAAQQWINQQENNLPGLPLPSIPNPFGFLAALDWIQEIGHWFGIAVAAITDVHMWISLGWLTLGFWLLVIGILLWLKIPQRAARAAKGAATAAAVVA